MGIANLARGAALIALATTVSGRLNIRNHCGIRTSVVLSHNGSCDFGPGGQCMSKGGRPWSIDPGNATGFDWYDDGAGTSVKISKHGKDGILQFEYAMAGDGLYWDLSDLDGSGGGLVGTPFAHDNVKVSPTGAGRGRGTCLKIRCRARRTCYDSYQHPDDPNTRWCPPNTGDVWLDLCAPRNVFKQNGVDEGIEVTVAQLPEVPTCEDCQSVEEAPNMIDDYLGEHGGAHPSQDPHNGEGVDEDKGEDDGDSGGTGSDGDEEKSK